MRVGIEGRKRPLSLTSQLSYDNTSDEELNLWWLKIAERYKNRKREAFVLFKTPDCGKSRESSFWGRGKLIYRRPTFHSFDRHFPLKTMDSENKIRKRKNIKRLSLAHLSPYMQLLLGGWLAPWIDGEWWAPIFLVRASWKARLSEEMLKGENFCCPLTCSLSLSLSLSLFLSLSLPTTDDQKNGCKISPRRCRRRMNRPRP